METKGYMEIDVTRFVARYDMWDFAHSMMEGGPTAGADTWRAALECPVRIVTRKNRDTFESWAAEFGAWDREEIAGWTLRECNALALQFIAGDVRTIETLRERGDYDRENGCAPGNTYQGDNGRWYFYMGS